MFIWAIFVPGKQRVASAASLQPAE